MSIRIVEDVELTGKKMSLVDLNGTQSNFETKFQISADPSTKYLAAIVSQDELDSGDLHFESCSSDGTYSRKIIRQDAEHQNYFIALRKHHSIPEDTVVSCHIIKQLMPLPPNESYTLPPREDQIVQEEFQPVKQQQQREETSDNFISIGVVALFIGVLLLMYGYRKK